MRHIILILFIISNLPCFAASATIALKTRQIGYLIDQRAARERRAEVEGRMKELDQRKERDPVVQRQLDNLVTELRGLEKKLQKLSFQVEKNHSNLPVPEALRLEMGWVKLYVNDKPTIGRITKWETDGPMVRVKILQTEPDHRWVFEWVHFENLELPAASLDGTSYQGFEVGQTVRLRFGTFHQGMKGQILAIFNEGDIVVQPRGVDFQYFRRGDYLWTRGKILAETCKRQLSRALQILK